MKIPIEQHKIKWPNFERNAVIALWFAVIAVTLISLWTAIETKETQRKVEAIRAIQDGHAVEVIPAP